VAKIMGNVFIQRHVSQNGKGCEVQIRIKNHSEAVRHFSLHETLPYSIKDPSPEPKIIPLGKQTDHLWKISLKPQEEKAIIYSLDIKLEEASKLPQLIAEQIDEELITGAKVVNV